MPQIARAGTLAATALAVAVTLNAEVVTHGRCGSSGSYVYVKNLLADKPVKATIGVSRQMRDKTQTSQRVVRVPPAGEVRLGCSQGSSDLKNDYDVISTDP